MKIRPSTIVSLFIVLLSVSAFTAGQEPTVEQRVAAFKQAIQQSQEQLRNYQWIETTTVRFMGALKSVQQSSCSSGADGKIQKIPVNLEPPGAERGGGRTNAKKKDEISDYIDRAVSLLHRYVPPDPELIRYSEDAGALDVAMIEPDRVARLDFHDFVQPGDIFSGTFDVQSNSIRVLHVVTYLDSPNDVVTLGVTFDRWYEGTGYLRKVSLTARAKDIKIVVDYNGYRPN